jgi:hypothetical protein
MTRTADGNRDPILHLQDANDPSQVTGYNVYRKEVPVPPPSAWPLVASDATDMDAQAPGVQWVDASGAEPSTGIWYYQVTAYNDRCPVQTAEGPF